MTETWGFIHCHERRNNNRVVQRLVQWERGGNAVQANIATFIPVLPDIGQHGAQNYLNPSTAVGLDTVTHFLTMEICPFSAQSVHFLVSS